MELVCGSRLFTWLLPINNALAEMENMVSLWRIIAELADMSCTEHVKP